MSKIIPPGGTIGILGGGQLGRMTALAAARLGLNTHIYDPESDAPAGQVAAKQMVAPYEHAQALAGFASAVDVATLEFENVPVESVRAVAEIVPAFPSADALAICQDRRLEKQACADGDHATAVYGTVSEAPDLVKAMNLTGLPAILKTARQGYDGKGQRLIESAGSAEAAWQDLGSVDCVLEAVVEFEREISVIVARGQDGEVVCYPPVENRHENHILAQTIAPADLPDQVAKKATSMATDLAERLSIVGLLAVEMFVTQSGDVLINEMAPRPHNSGHWTIEGCQTDQFEQLVRAVCGWPLGPVEPIRTCVMTNILGPDDGDWAAYAARPDGKLHVYGKRESRPGRKMGHFTEVAPNSRPPTKS